MRKIIFCILFSLCGIQAFGQTKATFRAEFISSLKDAASEPTSYAPVVLFDVATRLDWMSSQPLFDLGFVESNPQFTKSGKPLDYPVGEAFGHVKISGGSLLLFGSSIFNNTAIEFISRRTIAAHPQRKRLVTILSRSVKIGLSGFLSYHYSRPHFDQWQANKRTFERFTIPR